MATTTDIQPGIPVREGVYGDRVVAVEPGGVEFIPLGDRHGRPLDLFWTWMSPNLEFATIFVGVISVLYFQQTFGQIEAPLVGMQMRTPARRPSTRIGDENALYRYDT